MTTDLSTGTELTATDAQVRGWIRRMTDVPSVRGHAYRREGLSGWCECGFYCGGLGAGDHAYPPDRKGRHQLHLRLVRNQLGLD